MSRDQYLLQVRSLLNLPDEQITDVLEELESHLYQLDFNGENYLEALGDPTIYADGINNFKSPTFMEYIKQKSTLWLSLQYLLLYIANSIIALIGARLSMALISGLTCNDFIQIGLVNGPEGMIEAGVCSTPPYLGLFYYLTFILIFVGAFTLFTNMKAKKGYFKQIITSAIIGAGILAELLVLLLTYNSLYQRNGVIALAVSASIIFGIFGVLYFISKKIVKD